MDDGGPFTAFDIYPGVGLHPLYAAITVGKAPSGLVQLRNACRWAGRLNAILLASS